MFFRTSLASIARCKAVPFPKLTRHVVDDAMSIKYSQVSKSTEARNTAKEAKLKPWLDRKRIIFDVTHKLARAAINGLTSMQLEKSEEGFDLMVSIIDRYTGPKILKKLHKDSEMLDNANTDKNADLDLSKHQIERNRLEHVYKMFGQFSRKLYITPHHSKMYELEALAYKLPMLLCQLNIYERFQTKNRFKRSVSEKFYAKINHWVDVKQRNVKVGLRIFDQLQTQVPKNLESAIEDLKKEEKVHEPDLKNDKTIVVQKPSKPSKPKHKKKKGGKKKHRK